MGTPQCLFFVVRKKRLCRMTVRPGRHYCGEHEPNPETGDGTAHNRIPCPNDSKHTCYASKLEKHLSICNARQGNVPPYIEDNINAPADVEHSMRQPLTAIPSDRLAIVIEKINCLYEKYLQDKIASVPVYPIHSVVTNEFNEEDRSESSLRHLRQSSTLLHIAQDEGLVEDGTCYVELGAGKGQLSYYAGVAWHSENSRVLLIDRAALRHKRDNKLADASRIRADLAHLALDRVPVVEKCSRVVGMAKHLCGVATDYSLRCITAKGVLDKTRGIVLATCCHHRCEHSGYIANKHLQELGITGEDFNTMLGIVSWATCGDGRSRDRRKHVNETNSKSEEIVKGSLNANEDINQSDNKNGDVKDKGRMTDLTTLNQEKDSRDFGPKSLCLSQEKREIIGRRAKAIIDWGRVLYLKEKGFDARLCYYVPTAVSLENVCIVANK